MNQTALSRLAGQIKTETSAARKAIASAYFRLWDKPGDREVEAADIEDRASSPDETLSPTARTGNPLD